MSISAGVARLRTSPRWLAAAGILAVVGVAGGYWWWTRPLAPPLPLRAAFDVGEAATRVNFAPDGRTFVAAGQFGRISLRDSATGAERLRLGDAPRDRDLRTSFPITAFSPDGRQVAVGSPHQAGDISVYDTSDGRKLADLPETRGALALRFTPDGRTLTTVLTRASRSLVLKHWDTATWRERPAPAPDWKSSYVMPALSPDAMTAATAVYGRATIALWDLADGRKKAELRPHFGLSDPGLRALTFSPDGRTLAAAWADGVIRLWDLDTRTERAALPTGPAPAYLIALAFSPDGRTLACRRSFEPRRPTRLPPAVENLIGHGHHDLYAPSQILVWDLPTARPRFQAVEPWSQTSFELTISPDGRTLATIDHSRVKFWSLADARGARSVGGRQ
jgi:WD40 repeat protein